MTWKEKRIVTLLSTILAILSAALLIVLSMRYQASRDNQVEEENVPEGEVTDQPAYSALTYDNGSATLSFSLDESGEWIWSDDPDFPLNPQNVTEILSLLSALTPQQTIPAEEGTDYGLSTPAATVTATADDGKSLSLVIGKATTSGESYYTMVNGQEDTLYIFDGTLYQALQTPIYDMMRLPQLPELEESSLSTITIQGIDPEGNDAFLSLSAQTTDGEEAITWRCNGANVTDDPTVRAILEDVQAFSFSRCVDYRPSEEAASLCGFDRPSAVISVVYREGEENQTFTLVIGATAADGTGRYARLGEDETIYLLPTEQLDPLMRVSVNGLE